MEVYMLEVSKAKNNVNQIEGKFTEAAEQVATSKKGSIGGRLVEFKRQVSNFFKSQDNHVYRTTHTGEKLKVLKNEFNTLKESVKNNTETMLGKKHYKTVKKINENVSETLTKAATTIQARFKDLSKKEKGVFKGLLADMLKLKKDCNTKVKQAAVAVEKQADAAVAEEATIAAAAKAKKKRAVSTPPSHATSPTTSLIQSKKTEKSGQLGESEDSVDRGDEAEGSEETASLTQVEESSESEGVEWDEDFEDVEGSDEFAQPEVIEEADDIEKTEPKKMPPTDPLQNSNYVPAPDPTIVPLEIKEALNKKLAAVLKDLTVYRFDKFANKGNAPQIKDIVNLQKKITALITQIESNSKNSKQVVSELNNILKHKDSYKDSKELEDLFKELEEIKASLGG
jgi:hypothetical protein